MSSLVPSTVFKVLAGFKAQGIDVQGFLAKLGINTDEVMRLVGAQPPVLSAPLIPPQPEPSA